jgi:hypothetical protein
MCIVFLIHIHTAHAINAYQFNLAKDKLYLQKPHPILTQQSVPQNGVFTTRPLSI